MHPEQRSLIVFFGCGFPSSLEQVPEHVDATQVFS